MPGALTVPQLVLVLVAVLVIWSHLRPHDPFGR
jgi:hypothetical protein